MRSKLHWLSLIALLPGIAFAAPKEPLQQIDTIVILFLENHSFDNLFGLFPGADGINAKIPTQTREDGSPYATLPPVLENGKPDKRFPDNLPNAPFLISQYSPASEKHPDPVHRFYQTQQQINGGRMDKFVQYTNVGGFAMGYYHESDSPLWRYAKEYTLLDRFFTAAFGGSLVNHLWLICGCTPRYDNPPASLLAKLDDNSKLVKDGSLTPDGYVVNTIQPFSAPYDAKKADSKEKRLPGVKLPTIGDRLSEKGISWAWYAGDWNNALAGNLKGFIPHHHPFIYFANYGDNSKARKQHLKDEQDFLAAIEKGTLPSVSFYKPTDEFDLHPGYSKLTASESYIGTILSKLERSPQWGHMLVIVTFDDSGGFFDHVAPPARDRFGPGIRIPTILVSPFTKRGAVDHGTYDTTSILKLLEKRFGLKPLNDSYSHAGDLSQALVTP